MKARKSYLFLLLALALVMGCSPKSSYRVLSFFFDGVPDYSKKKIDIRTDSIPSSGLSAALVTQPIIKRSNLLVHRPFAARKCNSCHDEGVISSDLKPQPGICYSCHPNFKEKFNYLHGPVAGGYCTACHTPHKGDLPNLLRQKGQQICLLCHSSTQIMKNKVHAGIGDGDCTQCHDPHGGANRFVLK